MTQGQIDACMHFAINMARSARKMVFVPFYMWPNLHLRIHDGIALPLGQWKSVSEFYRRDRFIHIPPQLVFKVVGRNRMIAFNMITREVYAMTWYQGLASTLQILNYGIRVLDCRTGEVYGYRC